MQTRVKKPVSESVLRRAMHRSDPRLWGDAWRARKVSPKVSLRVSERVSARLLVRLSARLLARLFVLAKRLAKSLRSNYMQDSLRDSSFYAGRKMNPSGDGNNMTPPRQIRRHHDAKVTDLAHKWKRGTINWNTKQGGSIDPTYEGSAAQYNGLRLSEVQFEAVVRSVASNNPNVVCN